MEAMRAVLRHPQLDAAFKALALTLPAESDIAEHMASQGQPVDPQRIHAMRQVMPFGELEDNNYVKILDCTFLELTGYIKKLSAEGI